MTDDAPFPAALPAVVPSAIGPAISYSNIRAVTSRADSLLNSLDKKIRKQLHNGLDAAGQSGAKLESRVLSRLADQLNPVEQFYNDTVELIQHQLAANMAPAMVTLEDLASGDTQASQSKAAFPGQQQGVSQLTTPTVAALAGQTTTRAVNLTGGGPRPAAETCKIPDRATVVKINNNAQAVASNTSDPGGIELGAGYYGFGVDCCWKSTIGSVQALRSLYPTDWTECLSSVSGIDYGPGCKFVIFILNGTAKQQAAGFAYLKQQMDPQGLGDKPGQCGTLPIDCKTNPFDPSCPPDCVNHPEDPRCKPTNGCPPPCAPPCIEVNVPPCPPCPPLNLPTCIQIDLCDWDKFCKALKDCLVNAKEDCALDNDTAYVFKDCDGSFGEGQKQYWSTSADTLTGAATIEDAVKPSSLQNNQFVPVAIVGRNLFNDLTPV